MPASPPERHGTGLGGASQPAGVAGTRRAREWARAEGIDIKERGRVPAEVIEKYKASVA